MCLFADLILLKFVYCSSQNVTVRSCCEIAMGLIEINDGVGGGKMGNIANSATCHELKWAKQNAIIGAIFSVFKVFHVWILNRVVVEPYQPEKSAPTLKCAIQKRPRIIRKTVEKPLTFFAALVLLITSNGSLAPTSTANQQVPTC